MPTAAVFALAILSAIGGSFLATWLRIAYERRADLRTRMIDAADAFTTDALAIQLRFRDAQRALDPHGFRNPPSIEDAATAADLAVDGLRSRLARVFLLFGEARKAGRAAQDTFDTWDEARSKLLNAQYTDAFTLHGQAKDDQLPGFTSAAREAIYRPWWKR